MRRHPIPVVAACIVSDSKGLPKVLLSRKKESHDEKGISRNPELLGKREFPGGIIEGKETPEQALTREIREELNISIEVSKLLHAKSVSFKDRKPYLILFYLCCTSEEIPADCEYVSIFDYEDNSDILPGDFEVFGYLKELFN